MSFTTKTRKHLETAIGRRSTNELQEAIDDGFDEPNLDDLNTDVTALSSNVSTLTTNLASASSSLTALTTDFANGVVAQQSPLTDLSNIGEARFRVNDDGDLEVSENGDRWRRPTKPLRVFDIREYGAKTGQAHKVATRQAIQAVFDEINTDTYFGGSKQGQSGVVYFPVGDWWVDQTITYQGNLSAGVVFLGDHSMARGGNQGSVLIYDGDEGGTLLDCIGINGSEIRNLELNGGGKAKVLLWLRQAVTGSYPTATQVQPSSGVNVHSCAFNSPGNYEDSILIAAGKKDHSSNTYQSSEYRFFNCYLQGRDVGPGTLQGWGFKALDGGNTKNFVFQNCIFNTLYRGLEAASGYIFVSECNAGNIGGFGRPGGTLIHCGGNACTVLGGGMENGTPGYAARFIQSGQGTRVSMRGVYIAATAPADDYIVSAGSSSLTIQDTYFEGNSRNATTMLEWQADTDYDLDYEVFNGDKAYKVITPGTSAGSGGPTGTGTDITDGTVHWTYVNPVASNVLKLQASASINQDGSNWGGVLVENCSFSYNTTQITTVPLYDGSNNPINGGEGGLISGGDAGDFGRSVPVNVRLFGNSCGLYGSNINKHVVNWQGGRPVFGQDQLWQNNAGYYQGEPYTTVLRNDGGVYVVRLGYQAFTLNAAGAVEYRIPTIVDLPAKTIVTGCWVEVNSLFTGTSNPVMLSIGVASDLDAILAPVDISTATLPIVYGKYPNNNCLGVWLDVAKDQPIGTISDWSSPVTVYALATMDYFTDRVALNGGQITIYLTYKRMA